MLPSSLRSEQLEAALAPLGRYRLGYSMGRLAGRLIELYFVMVVVSLFVGFLDMFGENMQDEAGWMFSFLRVFMLSVLGLVLFGIIRKQVKNFLDERKSIFSDSGFFINIITILLALLAYYTGYMLGTRYLGNDMGAGFMLRWIGGIGSVFVLMVPYYLLKGIDEAYTQRYKTALITTALPALSPDARYTAAEFIEQARFLQSELFPADQIIRYTGSDLIQREHAHFACSHLKVMHKVEKRSAGKTEIKYEQLFNGYYIIMDFNKTFHGTTFIVPDEAHDVVGGVYGEMLNRLGARSGTTLALMEDPLFEKQFAVYTTDQQEARYILSPKLIERINECKKAFSQDIAFSFIGNHLYVAISCTDDLFSPPLFGPVYDQLLAEKQVHRLAVMATLPELFDLERKIWG